MVKQHESNETSNSIFLNLFIEIEKLKKKSLEKSEYYKRNLQIKNIISISFSQRTNSNNRNSIMAQVKIARNSQQNISEPKVN